MQSKKKLLVHTHHIASHFTNALWPAGLLLLFSYFVTGKTSYESASFYCFIISLVGAPFVFFSGFLDWKTRFQGRPTRIFNHKRLFGACFMVLSVSLVAWRAVDPAVAGPDGGFRAVYLGLAFVNTGFVTYLGHLGGRFI